MKSLEKTLSPNLGQTDALIPLNLSDVLDVIIRTLDKSANAVRVTPNSWDTPTHLSQAKSTLLKVKRNDWLFVKLNLLLM